MKAAAYLIARSIKNGFLETLKKPAKLIAYIVLIALMGFVIFSGEVSGDSGVYSKRDIKELYALISLLYTLILLTDCFKGVESGASFFRMSDVNLLFTAPIRPLNILIYGLIRQMGTSIMIGMVLIFQYAWIHGMYGISAFELFIVVLGYALAFFSAQLCSIAIYSFCAGNDARKIRVKRGLTAFTAAYAAVIIIPAVTDGGSVIEMVTKAAGSPLIHLFPISGWIAAGVSSVIGAPLWAGILGITAACGVCVLLIRFLSRNDADYYEDVLQATEVGFLALEAQKSGGLREAQAGRTKVKSTGIQKGRGAWVFLYKHMLEGRRARKLLLEPSQLIFIGTTIIFTLIVKDSLGDMALLAAFFMGTYMQLFSSAAGRWLKELQRPYIYLTPAPAFIKLIAVCLENAMNICVEASVFTVLAGIAITIDPLSLIALFFARVSFGILFMAGNVLSMRVLGSLSSKGLLLTVYFLVMIMLALPGIVMGVMISLSIAGFALQFAVMALWNILISLAIMFLCRNLLDFAQLA